MQSDRAVDHASGAAASAPRARRSRVLAVTWTVVTLADVTLAVVALAVVTSILSSSEAIGSHDARASAGTAIPLGQPSVGAQTRAGRLREAESETWAYLPVSYRGPPPWPEVTIEPSHADLQVGRAVPFAVRLQTGAEIARLSVEISYDPQVLQILDRGAGAGVQVHYGDFPLAAGVRPWSSALNPDGYFRYMFWSDRGNGSKGVGTLVWLDMLAVSVGTAALAVESVYVDYDRPDEYWRVRANGARVNVGAAPPIEPMDCPRVGGDFNALSVVGPTTDRPAVLHPDLNLTIRDYAPGPAFRGIVDYHGPADDRAPQLAGLVSGRPVQGEDVRFASTDIVNDWDWVSYRRADPLRDWPATLAQLDAPKGTAIRVPHSGYSIGEGFQVLVLYADPEGVTLKYTREDNVVRGYTLHIENICVDPSLLSLYERLDDEGRGSLPAMPAGQAFGVARQGGPRFAIRDTGQFMDPRARKDWWRGW